MVEFFYRYWFRTEVEGIENVPAEGGALLVSNHSGALPPDAAVIARAIREEQPQSRPLQITVEHFFKGYPGFSMLLPKIGCVAAHPANVHRLLYDERQLVLVFPEGRKGTEKLYRDRYQLRRFGRGGFVEAAMRGEAKFVPVCVVGAEEAAPIFTHLNFMKRLTGLLYFPVTPTFPWFGPLGMLGYLPAKFKVRFLEPIDTADLGGPDAVADKALVQGVADDIRSLIEENLHEMIAKRRSVWFGEPRRILIAGVSSYWGGRLAQALEGFEQVEAIIGVDEHEPTRELERTEYVKVANQHSLLERIVRAAEIDTVIDTRLVVDSLRGGAARRSREQRDRDDEHPRRLRREGFAGEAVRAQELRPLVWLRAGRPGVLHRGDEPQASPAHGDRARHRRGGGRGARLRRAAAGRRRSPSCGLPTSSAAASTPRTSAFSACRRCPWSSGSTRAPVRPRRRRGPRPGARHDRRRAGGFQRRR